MAASYRLTVTVNADGSIDPLDGDLPASGWHFRNLKELAEHYAPADAVANPPRIIGLVK